MSIASTASFEWIVLIPDTPNALEKRLAARPDHIAGLKPRVESGIWVVGGATVEKPPVPDEPRLFNGSFMIAKGASKEEVLDEVRKDVYAQRGVRDVDKAQVIPLLTVFRREL